MKTLPLYVNQNFRIMIRRKNLSHNLIAKVLGFTEFRVKQSYFNTNLTIPSSFGRLPGRF